MFVGVFRKTIGIILAAIGLGVLIALLLPFWGWILLVAACLIILRYIMVFVLKEGNMKIVVYKPGKLMRFVLKTIFKV
ncbi:MAG: hypothetical protein RSE41_10150 [Clostridia bacterium]